MAWPVSARLSLDRATLAPEPRNRAAGSRACTTTIPVASKATAMGSPTTSGIPGGGTDDEQSTIEPGTPAAPPAPAAPLALAAPPPPTPHILPGAQIAPVAPPVNEPPVSVTTSPLRKGEPKQGPCHPSDRQPIPSAFTLSTASRSVTNTRGRAGG